VVSRNKLGERLGIAVLAVVFASCASMSDTFKDNPKAVLGSVGGAAAGGAIAAVAHANPAVIAASVLAGGLLGGYIGRKLDDRDKRMAAEAAQQAFESNRTGQAATWSNPDSGNSGSVTPTRTYQLADGQYCREYTQDIYIGGEKHQTYGTACRQPDGSWKIQG
jgi:surface antigen